MTILETICGHADLVKLNSQQQNILCSEIRQFLVEHVARTGGHLASNLGAVELSVAIETVFDTQKDRLVFDVGHQSYVHKMLTGRQQEFDSLRQLGGIAGFPKPCESNSDAFVAGHASSSVSIALGMAKARTLTHQDYHVISLLGDGAATGGMVYEGLNNAAESKEPMVIILNDNAMSIARNVGGMARHLSKLRSSGTYWKFKQSYRHLMRKIPGGQSVYAVSSKAKNRLKRILLPTTLFENIGLNYLGPVDGHNVQDLISCLTIARDMNAPVVVHVLTQKGKGYLPAEEDPSAFHGIGKFHPESGKPCSVSAPGFSDAFGEELCVLARENPCVCAITAAMPGGTGLTQFQQEFPKRLFDVGIAEEHAVSMAGGLAKQGMVPVVAIYSTFLQRSFDQIMQDIALLHLHVVFAVDRAGLVGEDGETHHGVFDVGYLRQIPGMTVLCPASTEELRKMLRWAVEECDGPVAVRYPRGGDRDFHASAWASSCNAVCARLGSDIALLTYGTLRKNAMDAADILAASGVNASVIRLLSLSPLPVEEIVSMLPPSGKVVVVEEICDQSGIYQELSYRLRKIMPHCTVECVNLGNRFIPHGSIAKLYETYGLDGQSIADFTLEVLARES